MLICPKCGKEYPDGFEGAFCPLDGEKLSKQEPNQAEERQKHLICPKCGRAFSDGSYCRVDGTELIEQMEPLNSEDDTKQSQQEAKDGVVSASNDGEQSANTDTTPVDPKKQPKGKKSFMSRIAKVVGIIVLVLVMLLLLLAWIGSHSSNKWPKEIHTPSIEEIEDRANSINGPKISFSNNPSYNDSYHVLADNEESGSIYLSAYKSEDVGLYIERNSNDADDVYSQLGVAIIMSCDPSNDLDDAKELLSTAVSSKEETKNNVKYSVTITAERLILRVDIPEDEANTAATENKTSATGHSHKWAEATCTEPKTCTECGETEGEALGHDWAEQTYYEPKTCKRCGKTEGKSLEEESDDLIEELKDEVSSSSSHIRIRGKIRIRS